MFPAVRPLFMRNLCLMILALLLPLAGMAPTQVLAQSERALRDSLLGPSSANDGRTNTAPPVARFTTDRGQGFVLDRSQRNPLIQFDGDNEVWSLTPTPGPMGDIIFKNDLGEPVLKATRWGGMILFSKDRPTGDPVAVAGRAEAFEPGHMSPTQLFQHLVRTSKRASAALTRLIRFEADVQTPGADFLFADAATVTADAMVDLSATSKGRQLLAPVQQVRLIEGRPPSAKIEGNVLVLKLDLKRGWGGRPSSKMVTKVLTSGH
ncbi:hypothetical protein AEYBE204_05905 [Asticcacaulis sp. YBE204]|nr:hypothetical protein AEYBE204_05905 [Asticcacaulis sp. YBE204]